MRREIKEIRLEQLLPAVFRAEGVRGSKIWLTEALFRRGELTLVEAESGAGKSSMCAYIFGARTDFDGRILFDGKDTATFKPADWQQIRRESLAYLPQELSLFPELTAWENLQLKNSLTGAVSDRRLEEWLDRLGIASKRDTPAGRMSIGQQQRLAIIRALCQPFDFLLLDEPVSHLDMENNRIAAAMIAQEAERQGAGIIATSVGNHLLLPYLNTLKL